MMQAVSSFLSTHWFAAALLGFAIVAVVVVILCRRLLEIWFQPLLVVLGGVACCAVGGLTLGTMPNAAFWLLMTALVCVFLMLLTLILTGLWSRWVGYPVGVLLMFSFGGVALPTTSQGLGDTARSVRSLEFVEPWWLLLLLCLPVVWMLGWRSLDVRETLRRKRIESFRPWLAVFLRTALVLFLALALAEPRVRQSNEHMTLIFIVDRSASIPADYVDGVDVRSRRILQFINQSVQNRGTGHERDRAGLIVFGRKPRLDMLPTDAPKFNLEKLPEASDPNYTDIGAALKLALASFPDDTGKRIVLITDGNENLGNAEEVAVAARQAGVQIDVLPLAAGVRNEDEVLVERVEAPPVTEQGAQVPIRVLVRSYNPHIVIARLRLKQITEGEELIISGDPKEKDPDKKGWIEVKLRVGLNSFAFQRPQKNEQRSYTYEAEIQPIGVQNEQGDWLVKGRLPGDRVENNRARTHVVARGQRRVLILEGRDGDYQLLDEALTAAGDKKFKVYREQITSALDRYKDRDKLAVFLSNFDCVILANVSADQVSEDQQEALRTNTHDQGCGLVMIGGPDSFGAGGWQNTAVERALPVDADIKSLKVQGKGGLVLIMHASEMADGNMWQKKIAKLAVERLGPADEFGVVDFDWQCKWVIPFQEIGNKKDKMKATIDGMMPGDMPDFGPAVQMAHDALADPTKNLAMKHVIIISDGDPQPPPAALLAKMKAAQMTITTVGVATHGAPQDAAMQSIAIGAKGAKGNYYKVTDPTKLPAIYIKESRIVSQSFVDEKVFEPQVRFRSGPTEKLPNRVPELRGYVRTTPKNSPLVEIPLMTPVFKGADQDFPLLAYWHYGLGKSVAFTSDAGKPRFWSKDWQAGGVYGKFWEQLVDWSMRPTESRRLNMMTEYRDGKVKIIVEARDDKDKPDTTLKLKAGISGPGKRGDEPLAFVQKNSGQYELEIKAEDAGSYFVTAQAFRKKLGPDGKPLLDKDGKEIEEVVDSVRSGVTVPYSPEFADQETNTALLERLRERTDGKAYEDNDAALAKSIKAGDVFRAGLPRVKSLLPLWQWLLFATGLLLFFDIAVRRVSLDTPRVVTTALNWWARLRGLPIRADGQPEFMERLQTRKQQVSVKETRTRAEQRFESTGDVSLPLGADATAPTTPTTPSSPAAAKQEAAPKPEEEAGDYASRLLKAKKKALDQQRKPDKDK